MRHGEAQQHQHDPSETTRFAHDDVRRVETLVSAGWTWVEALEAVAQDAPAARRAPGDGPPAT